MSPSQASQASQASNWRRKPRRQRRRSLAAALGGNEQALATPLGPRPNFGLESGESSRRTLISGSIATLLHAGAVGVLLIVAAMAPQVVEEIVRPVKILKELPGSNNPAKAGPRALAARRPAPSPAAAKQVTQAKPVDAAKISAKALTLDQLEKAAAPKKLDRTLAESKRVEAKAADAKVQTDAVKMAEFQAVTVSPSDLKAPVVKYNAPKQIAQGEAVELSAAQAFQGYVETGAAEYDDLSTSSAQLSSDTLGVSQQHANLAIEFDPQGGEYAGGGGSGGVGGTPGTVPCLESAFVSQYFELVRSRMAARWTVPAGVPVGSTVVLHFELDASGSATRVSADPTEHPEYGASAVHALREASPFPAMNDAVRCLDGKRLKSTFTYEDASG
jgi:hypothetical protein